MRLKTLIISGFRNLKPLKLNFSDEKNLNVFIGANGQGKTNLLEAIYLLAFSKSFRTSENQDLIGFSEDFCSVEGEFSAKTKESPEGANRDSRLQVIVTKNPPEKGLKINGVSSRSVDFIGHLKAVFFNPDDLEMIHGAPRLRRRYLDLLLLQLNHRYLVDLMDYNALIKQRNALLRQIKAGESSANHLSVWDEKCVPLGYSIVKRRLEALSQIKKKVHQFYTQISQTKEAIDVEYRFSTTDFPANEQKFARMMQDSRSRDIEMRATTIGPHRDDLLFLLDKKPFRNFGSRGQWRSLVLALKFTEIELLQEQSKTEPLLLLDDVFSELDESHQRHLFEAAVGIQTLVTTTHDSFLDLIKDEKSVFKVQNGAITIQ
ncbi:DNA replication/repair protein RecF [Candidatus Peregrinibacteria bacterium]|nr:DNA replication/repair protein RecF [Candidatus Peregrinibacteria bacterium]